MAAAHVDSPQVLACAHTALGDERFSEDLYAYQSVSGGTQAAIWRGAPRDGARPVIAVRLTPSRLSLSSTSPPR